MKTSTAKIYANKLFNKFEGNGISHYSDNENDRMFNVKQKLISALNTIKIGYIEADNKVLKLKDVSFVDIEENVIIITTKNGEKIRYAKGFEYLEYVFKYNSYY